MNRTQELLNLADSDLGEFIKALTPEENKQMKKSLQAAIEREKKIEEHNFQCSVEHMVNDFRFGMGYIRGGLSDVVDLRLSDDVF